MTGPGSGSFRRLAVLIAVNFVDMVGFMIVLPLLPFYALELEASPELVGLLIASFSIAQLVAAPFWGRVSDRYGRRPALLIGLTASAIAYVVFAYAETLWLLFLMRLVQGAGGGTTGVAQAYVADTMAPRRRITISGRPGRRPSWRRKRTPSAWSARRTATSGLVSLARMAAMTAERFSAVKTSATPEAYPLPAGRF